MEGKLLDDVCLGPGLPVSWWGWAEGTSTLFGVREPALTGERGPLPTACLRLASVLSQIGLSPVPMFPVPLPQPSKQKRKFSSFFKSLVIELDKDLYGPDNHLVEVRP